MLLKVSPLLLILLFPFSAFSQKKVYTSIQENKKKYPGKNFSFEKVVDNRINKENIGFVYKSSLTYEHPADFKKPLQDEFLHFLSNTFPTKTSENKLLLSVKRFEIGHIVTGKRLDTGFVFLDVDFYCLKNDSAAFLYTYTSRLAEASENTALSHGNRIKRALLLSLSRIDSTLLKRSSSFYIKTSDLENLVQTSSSITHSQLKRKDSLDKFSPFPTSFYVLSGIQAEFCPSSLLTGVNIDVLFRLKKNKDFMLGFNTYFFVFGLLDTDNLPVNAEYNLLHFKTGLRLLKHLKHNLFFNMNPQLILGQEYYTYDLSYNPYGQPYTTSYYYTISDFLYGFEFDFGLYRIPLRKRGFFFGSDFFVRGTSSNMVETSFGIKLNLGFKF